MNISESLETIFLKILIKILKFFDADPDPGSFFYSGSLSYYRYINNLGNMVFKGGRGCSNSSTRPLALPAGGIRDQ